MLSTSISYLVGALAAPLLLLTAQTIPARADEPPTAASVAEQSSGQEKLFYRRYLQVENSTNEPLRVYVRYRTLTDKGEWKWFPQGNSVAVFEIPAGEK